MKHVLLVGFDPRAFTEWDPAPILAALAASDARFAAAGIGCTSCLFPPDRDAARSMLDAAFAARAYDCIVIGGGLRKPDDCVELFEVALDQIRSLAPNTPIAFNTNPINSLDAAQRWLDPAAPT